MSGSTRLTSLWRAGQLARLERAAAARYLGAAAVVVLVACIVRICVAVKFADINPLTANVWEPGNIAAASLKYGAIVTGVQRPGGGIFMYPTAFMPPLAIFVWMGVFKIFGVTRAALAVMIALNVLGGAVTVAYTIRISRWLFKSSLVGLLAGTIIALQPVFVYSVATYEQLDLYIPLLLIMFDLASSRFPASLPRWCLIGVVLAVAVLIRTEYLPLGVAIILGGWARHRQFRLAAVSLLVAFFLVVPWTIRNYVVFHRFIPVADTLGYNLFKGFNPYANGSGDWVDRAHIAKKMLGPQLAAVPLTSMYEVQEDDVYRASADRFIATHPLRAFAVLPVRKVFLFWFYDIYEPATHLLLYRLQFWPLFLLSILGLAYAARQGLFRDPDHRMLLIMFGMETFVMMAYAVHARYRMNMEPFLYGYAAVGGLWAWSCVRSRFTGAQAKKSPVV